MTKKLYIYMNKKIIQILNFYKTVNIIFKCEVKYNFFYFYLKDIKNIILYYSIYAN